MQKVVETYSDLCRLYMAYGHLMTLVSMMHDDFGMELPPTFYDGTLSEIENAWYEQYRTNLKSRTDKKCRGTNLRPRCSRKQLCQSGIIVK